VVRDGIVEGCGASPLVFETGVGVTVAQTMDFVVEV